MPQWVEQVEHVRRRVARFLHADAGEIAFTYSTSHAFNLLAPILGEPSHVVAMNVEALTDYLHRRLDDEGFEVASPRDRPRRAGITIGRHARQASVPGNFGCAAIEHNHDGF